MGKGNMTLPKNHHSLITDTKDTELDEIPNKEIKNDFKETQLDSREYR
jgi:hypothetical protein